MRVKKIYRNEAVEGQRFNITNTSAALSKGFNLMTSDEFKKTNPTGWVQLVDGSVALYIASRTPVAYSSKAAAEEDGNVLNEKCEGRDNHGRLRWTPFVNALAKVGCAWDWDSEWEDRGELTLWYNGKVLSVIIEWDDADDYNSYDIPRILIGYRFVSEDGSIPNEEIDKLNDLPNTPAIVRSLRDYADRYGQDE